MLASVLPFLLLLVTVSTSPLTESWTSTCTPSTYTFFGIHCTTQCNTRHAGGDYKSSTVSSLEACVSLCASESACTNADYHQDSRVCYLKGVLTNTSPASLKIAITCPKPSTTTKAASWSLWTSTTRSLTTKSVPTSSSKKSTTSGWTTSAQPSKSTTKTVVTTTQTSKTSFTTTSSQSTTKATTSTSSKCPIYNTPTVTVTATVPSTPNVVSNTVVVTVTATVTTSTVAITVTVPSAGTSTKTNTVTTTTTLSCLSTDYTAADHPATVGNPTPAKRALTSPLIVDLGCPIPTAVTSTVTKSIALDPVTTVTTVTATSNVETAVTITVTATTANVVVATTVVTATATALAPGNLEYRQYDNPFNYVDVPQRFNADYFKSQQPVATGPVPDINFAEPAPYAFVVQGFFLLTQTGQYRFDSGYGPNGENDYYPDEFDWMWVGNTAYTWGNDQTNFKAAGYLYEEPSFRRGLIEFSGSAGDAIAVTVLAANSDGAGNSMISATFPDGSRHQDDIRGYWIPACNRAATFT